MSLGAIIISNRDWLWVAGLIFACSVILLAWSYRRTPSRACRWICPLLKGLGIAALCFCLLEPLTSSQRARVGANLFAIVADNSQGLQLKDAGDDRTRGENLRRLLTTPANAWQQQLSDNFETRKYYFDERLQPTRDYAELNFEGRTSALGAALRNVTERYGGRPLAGVLLFTDGNATDIRGVPELVGSPPIYPVVIGSTESVPDLAVEQVRVTQTDFEDAPVSLQVDLRATGFQQDSILVRVIDEAEKVVAEQTVVARVREQLITSRFQVRPEKQGISLYRVVVRAASEKQGVEFRDGTREATLANNERVVVVQRGSGPFRILYVAGRPNWEYKYLNRALDADRMLEMVGLVRVASREPKFTFIGRSGETSNPLYRGFGEQSREEVEQYDQPVLVRLNTVDEHELSGGFPQTAEALFAYHAVIVDDLEADFFKPDQAALLQRFVSERGGGFLMLGGMESFAEGKYQRTPIGDMLPVYLEAPNLVSAGGEVKMNLTREGLLQAWARLRETEVDEKDRLSQMRPFKVMNRVGGARPGATVIASAADETGQTMPALVIHRFGHGRTAALTIGDLWLWGMRDKDSRQDMEKAWRQLLRWLVNDAPNRVDATIDEHPEEASGGVRVNVRVRDEQFKPLENASVRVLIEPLGAGAAPGAETNSTRLSAEASASDPGLYQVTYHPKHAGGYKVTAYATNSVGLEVGRAQAGWSSDPATEEFRSLTPNLPLLEHIARQTGGQIIRGDKLNDFVRELPTRQAPIMEPWIRPLWHTPALFVFALLCFVSEWGLRRWKGLP